MGPTPSWASLYEMRHLKEIPRTFQDEAGTRRRGPDNDSLRDASIPNASACETQGESTPRRTRNSRPIWYPSAPDRQERAKDPDLN